MKIKYLFMIIVSATVLSGCNFGSDKPEDLIEEPVYIDILTEIFLVQSIAALHDLSEKEDSLYTVLFNRYEISRDQFDLSHEYYQRQGEAQVARTDTIRERLRSEREAMMRARQEMREND